jgi:hypothetical protein
MEAPETDYERVLDAIADIASPAELELLGAYVRVALAHDARRAHLERLIDAKQNMVAAAQRLIDEACQGDLDG